MTQENKSGTEMRQAMLLARDVLNTVFMFTKMETHPQIWGGLPSALQAIDAALSECNPTLTECPRCKNDISKCDGTFAARQPHDSGSGIEALNGEFNAVLNASSWAECKARVANFLAPAVLAMIRSQQSERDSCICKGNWRAIVKDSEPRIGKTYTDDKGQRWTFFGVVHGDDDYYYGMSRPGDSMLLSCVGSIEGFGYTFTPDAPSPWSDVNSRSGGNCETCAAVHEVLTGYKDANPAGGCCGNLPAYVRNEVNGRTEAEKRIELLERLLAQAIEYSPNAYMETLRGAAWPEGEA